MLFEGFGKPEIIAPKLWQNINEFFKIQVSKENLTQILNFIQQTRLKFISV